MNHTFEFKQLFNYIIALYLEITDFVVKITKIWHTLCWIYIFKENTHIYVYVLYSKKRGKKKY